MKRALIVFGVLGVGCTAIQPRWMESAQGTRPTPEQLRQQPVAVSVIFPKEELSLWQNRHSIRPQSRVTNALRDLRERGPQRWKTHWQKVCPTCRFRTFSSEVAGLNPERFLKGLMAPDASAHLKHWAGAFIRDPLLVAVVLTDHEYDRSVRPHSVRSLVRAKMKILTYWIPRTGDPWTHELVGQLSDAETYPRKPVQPEGLEWIAESLSALSLKGDPDTSSPHWDRQYPYPEAPEIEQWLDTSLRKIAEAG